MKKITLTTLLFISSVCTTFAQKIKVACIGNSITYGYTIDDRDNNSYPAQLQKLLGENYQVENFGVNGSCAQTASDNPWVKTPEYAKAKSFMPDIVIIKLGTNDSKPQNWKNKKQFKKDLESLATEFASLESKPRIIIAYSAKAFSTAWAINDSIIVNGVIPAQKKVAKKHKWTIVDLYSATANESALFADGIHPDAKGAGIIAKKVKEAVINKKESSK